MRKLVKRIVMIREVDFGDHGGVSARHARNSAVLFHQHHHRDVILAGDFDLLPTPSEG